MTKRFRQASLSFKSLVVAVEDSEDLQVKAEASTASTCDQSNAQVTVCESLCCVDHTESYQPTNKAVLACMSNNGRHFMDKWFKAYPWLSICVTRKKIAILLSL